MPLEKKPFLPYLEEEERKKQKARPVSVWFNEGELYELERFGRVLREEKIGSVIKQLVFLGGLLLDEPKTTRIIDQLFINNVNNTRRGVSIVDPKFRHSNR